MLALLLVGWPQTSHLMSLFKINDIGIFYFSDNGDNCLKKKKREREKEKQFRDFPGCPVVKTLHFQCKRHSSIVG